ncbi:MAG TPA: DUF192 domain-containing protein [Pseudobdellovibrionaceae bacterium]|nr:DUF192 domain-containing protein [Pseudobdellovibrionaceae bacterium]
MKIKFINLIFYSLFLVFSSDLVYASEPSIERDFSQIQNKKWIEVGNKKIKVAIASSPLERAQGLMYVTHLPSNEGMLFEFDEIQVLSFWMKNTRIDLSIAFFDDNKKLINLHEMKTPTNKKQKDSELNLYKSLKPARYALEMEKGWFKKNQIKTGDIFKYILD